MSIITLTTDFGNKDFFVSSVKGAILSEVKNAMVIDVSNEIQPYNHSEAAYILKNAYKTFWVPVMGRFISGLIPLLEGKAPEKNPTYDIDGVRKKKIDN